MRRPHSRSHGLSPRAGVPDPIKLAQKTGIDLVTLGPDGQFVSADVNVWRELKDVIGLMPPQNARSAAQRESNSMSTEDLPLQICDRIIFVRKIALRCWHGFDRLL